MHTFLSRSLGQKRNYNEILRFRLGFWFLLSFVLFLRQNRSISLRFLFPPRLLTSLWRTCRQQPRFRPGTRQNEAPDRKHHLCQIKRPYFITCKRSRKCTHFNQNSYCTWRRIDDGHTLGISWVGAGVSWRLKWNKTVFFNHPVHSISYVKSDIDGFL